LDHAIWKPRPDQFMGLAVADYACLVVSANGKDFEESYYDEDSKMAEHVRLAKCKGVHRLIVIVNKMDCCNWSRDRYEEIKNKIGSLLNICYFTPQDIVFVPTSGVYG